MGIYKIRWFENAIAISAGKWFKMKIEPNRNLDGPETPNPYRTKR